jgi:hypothetical protein
MVNYIFEQLKNNKLFKFTFILFVLMVLWWSTIYIRGLTEGIENDSFTIVLPVFSLIGSIGRLWECTGKYSRKGWQCSTDILRITSNLEIGHGY